MNQNQPVGQGGGSKTSLIILIVVLVLIILGGGLYYVLGFKQNKSATPSSSPTSTPSVALSSPKVTPSTSAAASVKDTHCLKNPAKSDQIKVSSPADYAIVSKDDITLKGTANAFESQFDYRIKNCAGDQLASGFIQAEGEMGSNPPFTRTFSLTGENSTDIIIELFEQSAADGREINLTQVPLRLK